MLWCYIRLGVHFKLFEVCFVLTPRYFWHLIAPRESTVGSLLRSVKSDNSRFSPLIRVYIIIAFGVFGLNQSFGRVNGMGDQIHGPVILSPPSHVIVADETNELMRTWLLLGQAAGGCL